MRTASKVSLVLLLALLCAPIATLWVLGHSERALQMIVERLPERFGAIERLELRGVRGSLAGGFSIEALDVDHDLVHLRLRDVDARLELLPLLWQTIRIADLRLQRLEIDPMPRDLPIPDRPPRFLPGLVTMEIPALRVDTVLVKPAGGADLEFVAFESSDARILARRIVVPTSTVRLGQIGFAAEATLTAARPLKLEGRVQTRIDFARGADWLIETDLEGDLETARITGAVREPFVAEFADMSLRALVPWELEGKIRFPDLDASVLGASGLLDDLSGEVLLTANREGNRLRGEVKAPRIDVDPFDVDFFGRLRGGELEIDRLRIAHTPSTLESTLEGTVQVSEGDITLDLRGEWDKFRWPLRGAAPLITSPTGSFSLTGRSPHLLDLQAQVARSELPAARLSLTGSLFPGELQALRGELAALGGEIRLRGDVAWRPEVEWALSATAMRIDPGQIREELRGAVDAEVQMRGRGSGPTTVIDIELLKLGGQLRETRVRGSGGLRWNRDTWQFRKLDIGAGGLQLSLDGTLSARRRDLEFRILASDLGVLAENGRGRLQAEGELRGTAAATRVKLSASGRDISLLGIELASLGAQIDIDPLSGPDTPALATVDFQGLSGWGRVLDRGALRINGTSNEHVIKLEAAGKDLDVSAVGSGRLGSAGWQQDWSRFDLQLLDDIRLTLDERMRVTWDETGLAVAPFCLLGAATICATGERRAENWRVRLDLSRLPIATLLPRPSPRASYDGTVNVSAELHGEREGLLLGSARADFRDAALRWQRAGGKQDLIELGAGFVELDSTTEAIVGRLQIVAGDRGRARGQLRAERSSTDWRELPLRADLAADSSALALLYLYVPEIDRSAGDLSADLIVGGTLGAPLVNGVLRLKKGELDFYQINLALRDVDAEARLIDNGFVLKSSAKVGGGEVQADAQLLWRNRQPFGELRLRGKDLTLVDLPEAKITASPDLAFTVAGRELKADGSVRIPFARLTPADLTGAILASSDEILEGQEPIDPASSFRVTSNLRLELGDQVSVEALGLSARLGGAITVSSTPDGINRGVGELNIAQGKYAALGRLLDIERGRLIFSGGLLEDPAVDLRATKIFPDVKAGVNVRGTLRDPRLTFFSEPALPQSQVVSLILAGGNLESAQGGNTERDALLAQGGAILAQQIGQRIGIDDVGIEQNLANETSLVFGKYLSSRLYVSYGVSLAEAINTFKMRYTLNDRWTIRTEAGKESSVEVVYTVEKN